MKISMLVIGDEILNGKIYEKNAHFAAIALRQKGISFNSILTCPDDKAKIISSLKILFSETDLVITSGGLGPTIDDVTKESIAEFFNKKISFQKSAQDIAVKNYQRRGRDYFESPKTYENFIEDATPLNNPAGMAPGIKITQKEKTLFALPGVPTEFTAIFNESILPSLKTDQEIFHFTCRTKFTPESKVHSLLENEMPTLKKYGSISFLPHPTHVDLGISFSGSKSEIEKKSDELKTLLLNSPIKDIIWHFGSESLEEVIIKKATDQNLKIALAESCTGGLNAHRLTNVSGSSNAFLGSVVSYDNSVKEVLIHVSSKTLKEFGAVSEQTALEMAKGALKAMNADIAISTTGIAGPGGGSTEKPVGTVWVGVATNDKSLAYQFHFHGDRAELKERFSNAALFKLLECLEF